MASIPAPTYYFSGIGFNSSFYISSSSGLTIGQLNNFYVSKKNADSASGLITFKNGITVPIGNITTVNTVYTDKIQPYYPADSINFYTTGTGVVNLGSLNNTLNLCSALCPNALSYTSSAQIGWSEKVIDFSDVATTAAGSNYTKTSQSLIVGTQLPIGTYLMTMTCSTILTSGIVGGTTTTAGCGYFNNSSYGSTSGIQILVSTVNTSHPLLARVAGQYYWNFSQVINNTINNGYLYGMLYWPTSLALTAGSAKNVINCYTLTRIA